LPGEPAFRTDWLCGAVLLGRRSVLARMGGFDPRIFLYFEETDLCRRLLDAGMELWAVGAARATHVGGSSTKSVSFRKTRGCVAEHYYESRFYYLSKHHGYPAAVVAELGELGLLCMWSVGRWLLRRDGTAFRERIRSPVLRKPPKVSPEGRVPRVARG
jgi:N-acetylglucosaminyl-diphospho-decaprenol L-rhamnosyltransferase